MSLRQLSTAAKWVTGGRPCRPSWTRSTVSMVGCPREAGCQVTGPAPASGRSTTRRADVSDYEEDEFGYSWEYQTCRECDYWIRITRWPYRHVRLHVFQAQPW